MKYILALAVVFAAVAVICDSSAIQPSLRTNLNVGTSSPQDRVIYRNYVYRAAKADTIQSEEILIRGNANNKITSMQATEVGTTQLAATWITGGGLGFNNVSIRFESYRGNGYYYLLEVWVR